jgi:hypothetical protein
MALWHVARNLAPGSTDLLEAILIFPWFYSLECILMQVYKSESAARKRKSGAKKAAFDSLLEGRLVFPASAQVTLTVKSKCRNVNAFNLLISPLRLS